MIAKPDQLLRNMGTIDQPWVSKPAAARAYADIALELSPWPADDAPPLRAHPADAFARRP